MKYSKAIVCDFCGRAEVSISKCTFKTFIKRVDWIQVLRGDGLTNEYCSQECFENYKQDVKDNLRFKKQND